MSEQERLTPEGLAELRRIAEAGPAGDWDMIELEHSTVLALLYEIERLRREVREWMCDGCNTVYPGPPQPGIWCVQCPRCGGDTAPRDVIERRRLEREIERLRRVVEQVEWVEPPDAHPDLGRWCPMCRSWEAYGHELRCPYYGGLVNGILADAQEKAVPDSYLGGTAGPDRNARSEEGRE